MGQSFMIRARVSWLGFTGEAPLCWRASLLSRRAPRACWVRVSVRVSVRVGVRAMVLTQDTDTVHAPSTADRE